MKKKFSKKWIASKQPRKQRKFLANAPIHIKKKLLSVNLSKSLRKRYSTRNLVIRKDDTVKIMRGKYKKKQGKVTAVKTKMLKIYVEGIQIKKQDGSKVPVALRPSNLQIVELNLEDKKRSKFLEDTVKESKTPKKEVKPEKGSKQASALSLKQERKEVKPTNSKIKMEKKK